MYRLIISLVILFSVFSIEIPTVSAYTNDCPGWSRELRAKSGSRSMHMLGCRWSGTSWIAASNTCNTKARYWARQGYRGEQIFNKIVYNGCAMDNYGKYYVAYVR